eukprot:3303989-Rhodomonas_salina.1
MRRLARGRHWMGWRCEGSQGSMGLCGRGVCSCRRTAGERRRRRRRREREREREREGQGDEQRTEEKRGRRRRERRG